MIEVPRAKMRATPIDIDSETKMCGLNRAWLLRSPLEQPG
jgi:hypothetical protein